MRQLVLTLRPIAFCTLLGLSVSVAAQLKPSGGTGLSIPGRSGTSPAPASPAAPAAEPAPAAKPAAPAASSAQDANEKAGQLAAAGWLTLLDRRDWGTAWETSAGMFRKNVPLDKWMEGAPKARADFGTLQERVPGAISYKKRLEGLPPGDYVSVVFVSKFAQKGEVQEVVTTVREADGRWRVTGYSTR